MVEQRYGYLGGQTAPVYDAPPVPVQRTPAIQGLLSELEAALSHGWQANARLNETAGRLMNPRPQGVGDAGKTAQAPNTVESRLQALLHAANGLAEALHQTASRFDEAV